jgi:hypothetical protein
VVRLINGERTLRGKKPVRLDTFLAAKAHDSDVRCPNDAKRLNQGRAQSLAAQNVVPPSHALPLCKSYTGPERRAVLELQQHARRDSHAQ